jgi:hypothetical protein
MPRKLRIFMTVFPVVLASGALSASAASAQQGKITSTGPVILHGTEFSENEFLYPGLPATKCPESHTTWAAVGTTPHDFITPGSTQATVVTTATNCKVGVFPATLKATSCDYKYVIGVTTGGVAHTYGLTTHIECTTPGDSNHLEVYSNAAHTNLICSVTFGAQTPTSGLHVTYNTAAGTIRAHGLITKVKATRTNLGGCPPSGTTEAAEFKLDVTVGGSNESGGTTPFSISD